MALTDSLVGYWKCDEASGTLLDSVGSLHGTDVNTVTSTTGMISGARQFTRANSEYFNVPDTAALDITGPFTVAGWFYLDALGAYQTGLSKYAGGQQSWLGPYYHQVGVQWVFYVSANGTTDIETRSTLAGVAANTWYFVALWYDGSTINISSNNGTPAQTAHSTGIFSSTAPLRFGNYESADHWGGRMDEIGLWSRALSGAELTALYNGGAGLTYPFGEVSVVAPKWRQYRARRV